MYYTSGMLTTDESLCDEPTPTAPFQPIGEVVISKESTLEVLKHQILTLPKMAATVAVPTTHFLRVRLMENGRPTTVLRNSTQTLQ